MYGDKITEAMNYAITETNRRRAIQDQYNKDHDITPHSVNKAIDEGLRAIIPVDDSKKKPKLNLNKIPVDEYKNLMEDLTAQMQLAAANLEFEKAAELRDTISEIKERLSKHQK